MPSVRQTCGQKPGPPASSESVPQGNAGIADPGEIERLFREHNDSLLRFISARIGSGQEAREIAQEAYVRLLSLDQQQAVSYLKAYLFKTAANLTTDRLRERTRRSFLVPSRDSDFTVFELSPERQIDGEERLARLRAALSELPEKCRSAFILTRIEGLRPEDVAQRLQVEPRSVWRYVARALEYLHKRVYEDAPPMPSGSQP